MRIHKSAQVCFSRATTFIITDSITTMPLHYDTSYKLQRNVVEVPVVKTHLFSAIHAFHECSIAYWINIISVPGTIWPFLDLVGYQQPFRSVLPRMHGAALKKHSLVEEWGTAIGVLEHGCISGLTRHQNHHKMYCLLQSECITFMIGLSRHQIMEKQSEMLFVTWSYKNAQVKEIKTLNSK